MKPQPCQLALLMSIAGLGTSLAGGAQARTHAWAEARPLAVEGWPLAAGAAPWPVLPIEQQGLLALTPATIEPPLKPDSADALAGSLDGTQPHPPAPAPHQAANGLRVRTPTGPRSAERGTDLVLAGDAPPDADREPGTQVPPGEESARVTEPGQDGAQAAAARPARVVAAFAALAPAEPVAARTVEARASPEPKANAGIDVNLDLNLQLDVDLDQDLDLAGSFDIDLGYEPVAHVQAGSDAGPARVDIELDMQAGRASSLPGQMGMPTSIRTETRSPWRREAVCSAPSATVAFDLAREHEVDVFLDLATGPRAPTGQGPEIRHDQPPAVAAVQPAAAATADATDRAPRKARPSASTGDGAPSIVVGDEVDRVLHALQAQVRKSSGGRPAGGGEPTPEVVFVATQEEKVLMTLETLLASPAPKPPAGPAASQPRPEAPPAMAGEGAPAAKVEASPAPARQLLGDKVALDDSRLDNIRGGFETPDGVILAFGIERAVYINGSLVTTTNLQVASNPGGSGGLPAIAAGTGNLTLIQNGAGNAFITGPVSAANLGTVIQNTLNDQQIQHVLSVNATVNSLQLTRAQNFESAMRGALVDSLRR